MIMYREISGRYWAVTVGLLIAGLDGWHTGFFAIALTAVQVATH
jgi:hypothetical protein